MTTKYLTGAYPSGYTVASSVTSLDIESTASIGGTGVSGLHTMYFLQITNDGTVQATSGYGMALFPNGANIVNGMANHAALIEGSRSGISASNTSVTNFGTIEGLGTGRSAGVALGGNCAVTNGSAADTGALLEGFQGINGEWSEVSNFGSIVGTGAAGISFGALNGSNSVTVTNGSQSDHAASIQGTTAGVYLRYTIGTLTNWGTISTSGHDAVGLLYGGLIDNFGAISSTGASGTGIALGGNVSVVNGSAQDITASVAGVAYGITSGDRSPATIVNYGTVLATGSSGYGVVLNSVGHIRNGSAQDASALIEGGKGGVLLRSDGVTIVNFGTVAGGSAGGVMMSGAHDVLTNGSATNTSALITGSGPSVVSGTGDTVVDYGTISGLALTSASDVLRVEAGCVFESPVQDAGTLSLVDGVGNLSGLTGGEVVVSGSMAAATFSGFGTLGIGKAAKFTLAGSGEITAGQTLNDQGVLTVTDSLAVQGAVTGSGVIALAAGATARFDGAAPKALTVSLRASGSVLELADPSAFAATIGGLASHGKIDLVGIVATAAVLGAGDKLTITNGTAMVATLQLAGAFGGDAFVASSDGSGGTFITVTRTAATAPPAAALPAPHAFIAAAAALGATGGAAHATAVAHDAIWRTNLSAPRPMVA